MWCLALLILCWQRLPARSNGRKCLEWDATSLLASSSPGSRTFQAWNVFHFCMASSIFCLFWCDSSFCSFCAISRSPKTLLLSTPVPAMECHCLKKREMLQMPRSFCDSLPVKQPSPQKSYLPEKSMLAIFSNPTCCWYCFLCTFERIWCLVTFAPGFCGQCSSTDGAVWVKPQYRWAKQNKLVSLLP